MTTLLDDLKRLQAETQTNGTIKMDPYVMSPQEKLDHMLGNHAAEIIALVEACALSFDQHNPPGGSGPDRCGCARCVALRPFLEDRP